MAEGGDDSAQDIHQPSNRNLHFWQNYYSIFENQDPPPHTHARNSDTHTHTMTERGFYDLYEINLFISTTARQHSTSKLFQRGLRQIGLHAPKTDCYLFIYLFYWTQPAWRWTFFFSTIYLLPAVVVLISREVVFFTFLDSGHYMLSNGELLKNYSPPEVVTAHASEQSVQQHWEEPCNK